MFKTFIFISTLFMTGMVHSQGMLIEQIAGREVVRKAFDEDKELISTQIFKVGPLQTYETRLHVELQAKLYDEDGRLSETYTTRYICEPNKPEILLSVFPFARQSDAQYVIEASSYGFKTLYDFKPGDVKLADLNLEMSIKSGILGFFASKNQVSITNRRLNRNNNGFTLKSDITIEAYLWRLKVKTIRYRVTEKLDANKKLLSQMFVADDGSYFFMNY